MRKLISNTALVAIAASGMLLASCSDHDMYNPNYKSEEYAANWEDKIGTIAPNQDWSMATSVTASINVAAAGNGVLSIYTNNPILPSSRLLTKVFLNNGTGKATFDAIKGADQVFVVASNNGKNVVYGWADIINGTVDASKTVAKKEAKTRAGETCPVTKGETVELINKTIPAVTHTETQIVETPIQYTVYRADWGVSGEWYNSIDELGKAIWAALNNKGETWHHNNPEYIGTQENGVWTKLTIDVSTRGGKEEKEVEVIDVPEQIIDIALTMLNNVEQTAVKPWAVSWGWELFGDPNAFFKESVRYDNSQKTSIPGYNLTKVEQGFAITTEGGEINVPFIFGATQHNNRFGYVYYKEGQDPLTQPHYILMADGRPQNNIYFNSWRSSNPNDGMGDGMKLSNWNETEKVYYGTTPETLVYGTNYKLAFFGENHKQSATYTFPKGYKVVFFIAPLNGNAYNTGKYNYSLPELNKRIGHTHWVGGTEYPDRGAVKATAWTYNGHVYMGFEDGGNDEDLNDIVFWVEGDFNPDQDIPEVPSTTTPQETAQSWILACEDLGSTDDYDFNDIVLEVRQTMATEEVKEGDKVKATNFKKATLEVRCLAAGGIYPANITYDNGRIAIGESHALLGGSVGNMLNTEKIDHAFSKWITLESTTNETEWENIQNADSWSINTIAGKIQIVVTINDKASAGAALIEKSTEGTAPQMIIVPGNWSWPKERKLIYKAYSNFDKWNGNTEFTDWYTTFDKELLIQR